MSATGRYLFTNWTDDELRELSATIDAATGEGQRVSEHLVLALVEECDARRIEMLLAYDHGERSPECWLADWRLR